MPKVAAVEDVEGVGVLLRDAALARLCVRVTGPWRWRLEVPCRTTDRNVSTLTKPTDACIPDYPNEHVEDNQDSQRDEPDEPAGVAEVQVG